MVNGEDCEVLVNKPVWDMKSLHNFIEILQSDQLFDREKAY